MFIFKNFGKANFHKKKVNWIDFTSLYSDEQTCVELINLVTSTKRCIADQLEVAEGYGTSDVNGCFW